MEIFHHPVLGELPVTDRVSIYFEGQELKARRCQTVASALMANGIYTLGVSRKLRQPRGVFCMNGRCFSCYMTINGTEHVRACTTLVEEGMTVERCMGDPDLRRNVNGN